MSTRTRRLAVVLGAAALTVPSAAVAASGKGKGPDKPESPVEAQSGKGKRSDKAESPAGTRSGGKDERGRAKGKAKRVKLATYVVKGVYDEAGLVDVTGGNSHARRAGLIRDDVDFDFGRARLVVADTDGNGAITVADLEAGDRLTIQLKLPRSLGDGPYVARKVVDRTHPPRGEDEAEDDTASSAPDTAGEAAASDA